MAVLMVPPYLQFFDSNGDVLAGGKIYTYTATGTFSTLKATYTTEAGTVEHPNPVILDASGIPATGNGSIWLDGTYDFLVADSNDVTVETTLNVTAFTTTSASSTAYFETFSGTGSQTAFTTNTDLGTDEKTIYVWVDQGLQETVTNGTFATDSDWTKGSGWTIGSGVATATGAISTAIEQTAAVTLVEGQAYSVTYTITRSAGGLIPSVGGNSGTEQTASGTYTEVIIAGSTQTLAFTGNAFTGTLDNVSITQAVSSGFNIQSPNDYTIDGTTLTFATAPASGTNNIRVSSPSTFVGAAASSAADAATSAAAALASETEAEEWASKVDGIVDATDYSAKAYAIGGTGVTDTAGRGAAKEWAIETASTVDTSEYSAKEYAIGTQIRGAASGGSSKDWATYTAGTVDDTEYSAKYYANEASTSVASAVAPSIKWTFDTSTTMADPGTGDIRLNNGTVSSVTQIAVSASSADTSNPDVSDFVATWDDSDSTTKGTLILRKNGEPQTFATFTINGAITDNTTWLQIPVTYTDGNGTFSASDVTFTAFSRTGDAGSLGSITQDIDMNGNQMQWSKGADVASATALPILTDGNYFDVTGTTTITSINTTGTVGTVIKLHFDGALTLTHHATDLILPGGANITTAAGDEAEFIEYASGDFRCTNYSKADGTAVISSGGGMGVLLDTQTASASTELDFTSSIDGTYDKYIFEITKLVPSVTGEGLYFRTSTDGGSSFDATAYDYHTSNSASGSASYAGAAGSAATQIALALSLGSNTASHGGYNGTVTLNAPNDAVYTSVYSIGATNETSAVSQQTCSGRREVAEDVNAVRFFPQSGNFTSGVIRMYGINNS